MRKLFAFLLTACVLTSCGQPSNQVLPTLIPTLGQVEQPTQTAPATQAPTAIPLDRPTLPPTWTPQTQTNSSGTDATPVSEPTQPPVTQPVQPTAVPAEATLVVCGTFVADRDRSTSTFKVGTAPQAYWSPVATAQRYRVDIIDQNGSEIFSDYTLEPTYTFRADLFERGKRYGWEVYPEDSFGRQMCLERGAELFPQ